MKTKIFTTALMTMFFFGTFSVNSQTRNDDNSNRGNQERNTNVTRSATNNRDVTTTRTVTKTKTNAPKANVNQNRSANVSRTRTTVIKNKPTVIKRSNPRAAQRTVYVKTPNRAHSINRIDNSYVTYRHGAYDYAYRDGVYYRHRDGIYNRCAAPYGLRVRVIPNNYRRIVIGSIPYFYYSGIYYRENNREYEVVQPPVGAIVPELPDYGVSEVVINNDIYYEYDNVLYKPVVTRDGIQYRVVGNMDVQ